MVGESQRWMRQAPDLFDRYMTLLAKRQDQHDRAEKAEQQLAEALKEREHYRCQLADARAENDHLRTEASLLESALDQARKPLEGTA